MRRKLFRPKYKPKLTTIESKIRMTFDNINQFK